MPDNPKIVNFTPKVINRQWTKSQYKEVMRYCRKIGGMVTDKYSDKIRASIIELMIYGQTEMKA